MSSLPLYLCALGSKRSSSKAQYIRQFKKWRFEKNTKSERWKQIAKVVAKRKSRGKESEVSIHDRNISEKQLRKEMSRYREQKHEDKASGTMLES